MEDADRIRWIKQIRKPSWNAAQPCARAQGCVNDDLRADGLRKGWQFRVRLNMEDADHIR